MVIILVMSSKVLLNIGVPGAYWVFPYPKNEITQGSLIVIQNFTCKNV